MFRLLSFSTKSGLNSNYNQLLSSYKQSVNQLLESLNSSIVLEKIGVKLGGSKKDAPISELGTINVLDSHKVELTTFDPQV